MNTELTTNRPMTPATVRVRPVIEIGGNDELRKAAERSDAFLSNRLRARTVRRSCPVKFSATDFVI